MPRVLLTGATGFIGRRIMRDLQAHGYDVLVALRSPAMLPRGIAPIIVGDLGSNPHWEPVLDCVDAVIHTAAIAHTHGISDSVYEQINTQATLDLANAAADAGVARFIFLSSIRAQSGPTSDRLLIEADPPHPTDAYGRSKLNAENGLALIRDMDWVALRPVLVYGTGVKGNMARFMQLARMPIPLPFKNLTAQRSLVSLDNVSRAILTVLAYPRPLKRPLIVAEPTPLSIPDMIIAMRRGLNRKPLLFPVKQEWLEKVAHYTRKTDILERFTGSLIADSTALLSLGWQPEQNTSEQLASLMTKTYLS